MGPIRDRHGPSGHGFELRTHIWVLHGLFMGQVGMGLNWEHNNFYGPSGHGFELGTHIWVLHGTFMGQVGMGLNWEHIYGSCMVYLWAKWAWV